MRKQPKIILGSQSPRRRQILANAGYTFDVRVSNAEEDFPITMEAKDVPQFLANKKNEALRASIKDELLITADSIVVIEGEILNKPQDKSEAITMLRKLSGRIHQVYTGVCLYYKGHTRTFVDKTEVSFYAIDDEEIEHYIQSEAPYDKAGSYGIQDWIGLCKVKAIVGDYNNVVGLPMHRIYHAMKELQML